MPKDSLEWKLLTFVNNTKQPVYILLSGNYLFLNPETKDDFIVGFSEFGTMCGVQINGCYLYLYEEMDCTLESLPPTIFEFDLWRMERIKDSFIVLDEGSIFFKEINTEVFYSKILTKDNILYKIDKKTKWFEGKTNDQTTES